MKTRPVNSRVQHGHPSCANYGCKREECLSARRRAMKQREYLLATGRSRRTGTDRTAPHIAKLRAAGMRDAAIRLAAGGLAADSLYKAARTGERILRSTEDKILAVEIPSDAAFGSEARIDGRSTLLRLRALLALGWPRIEIAKRIDGPITGSSLSNLMLRLGRPGAVRYVELATAQRVQAVYEQLWNKDPLQCGVRSAAVSGARRSAAKNNWRLPMDLNDDRLDDPRVCRIFDCSPAKPRRQRRRGKPIAYKSAA